MDRRKGTGDRGTKGLGVQGTKDTGIRGTGEPEDQGVNRTPYPCTPRTNALSLGFFSQSL